MSNIINWTNRATKDLEKITRFNLKLYSVKKTIEISQNILNTPKILQNSSINIKELGQIDESFNHLKRKYRKIITSHYKITYRIGKGKIYIVRVFDTRQNPNKNR